MKKSFVYEYETTRKRKMLNGLETVVNYALLFTFTIMVSSAIALALIHLVFTI